MTEPSRRQRTRRARALALHAVALSWLLLLPAVASGGAITSNQTGNWSNTATWVGGAIPVGGDTVTIAANHTVTVDGLTASASTITILGTLTFSRVAASSLTMVGGEITVEPGGALDMGTEASPIPAAATAHLVLAYGDVAGQYGLIVKDGGDFTVRGTTIVPFGGPDSGISAGAQSTDISAFQVVGWNVGDVIAIGPTQGAGPSSTEERVITSITGTDPKTIAWSGGLSVERAGDELEIMVANLTRNVMVRSSSTYGEGRQSYIRNMVSNTTSFSLVYGEFRYLGVDADGKRGISFEDGSGVRGEVSTSTIRDGYRGISIKDAGAGTFIKNSIYKNNAEGMWLRNSSSNSLLGNVVFANTNSGIVLASSHDNLIRWGSTFSNGDTGASVNVSSRVTVRDSKFYCNDGYGTALGSSDQGVLRDSNFYTNAGAGLRLENGSDGNIIAGITSAFANGDGYGVYIATSESNVLFGNETFSNSSHGVYTEGAYRTSFVANRSYNNTSGIGYSILGSSEVLFGGNLAGSNQDGYLLRETPGILLAGNHSFANTRYGFHVRDTSATLAAGAAGYDDTWTDSADATAGIHLDPDSDPETVTLLRTLVNPSGDIGTSGFNAAGTWLVSYDHNYSTGSRLLHGDYTLQGSTWTLDYSAQVRASTATTPRVLRGNAISVLKVNSTSDSEAISQLVRVVYEATDSKWHVIGSSSGEMGTFGPTGGTADFPSGSAQFNLTLTASGPGDLEWADFVLLAASQDSNTQKRLLFGDGASSWNQGRSKLTIASDGGIVLKGTPGWPTVVDRLSGASTYYTFVDSGAFTAEYSSMTNMDPGGFQLSGSAGVSIATSAFDYMGIAEGTNSYITARDLTSHATFYGLTFGVSRSTVGGPAAYSVRVEGSGAGHEWILRRWRGDLGGELWEDEGDGFVGWTPFAPTPDSPPFPEVHQSSITAQWVGELEETGAFYNLRASSAANFTGTVHSSVTEAMTGTFENLFPNTTYYFVANAVEIGTSPYGGLGSTGTLALAPVTLPETFTGVFTTTITAAWAALAPSPSSASCSGYVLEASSTDFDGSGTIYSSATASVEASTLTVKDLWPKTTYYFRAASLNHRGAFNYLILGSTVTYPADNSPPTNVSVSDVRKASTTLTWLDVNSDEGYSTEASTAPDFSGTVFMSSTTDGQATTLTIFDLAPNTTYYLRAGAIWTGTTYYAQVSTRSTLGAVPGGAASTFTAVHFSSMSLSWERNGNPVDITTYTVVLTTGTGYPNSFTGNKVISTFPAGGSPAATLTSLDANTTYNLFIEAVNHEGAGSGYRVFGETVTYVNEPVSAPPTEVTHSSFTAHWGANGNWIGTLFEAQTSTAPDFSVNKTSVTRNTFAVFDTLYSASTYYFQVRAVAHSGLPTAYVALPATMTLSLPPAAAAVPFTAVGESSVTVAFDDGGNPGGTEYTVRHSTDGFSTVNNSSVTKNLSVLFGAGGFGDDLARNTTYQFRARSEGPGGHGQFVDLGSTSTLAGRPLSAASTFSAVATDGFGVSWDNNGNPLGLSSYTAQVSTAPDFSGDLTPLTTAPAAAFGTFTGLDANTTYYLRIRAVNHNGIPTSFTDLGSTATLAMIPTAAGVTFAETGPTSMTVAWDRNGNPVDVTTYTVVLTTGSSYPNSFAGNQVQSTAPAGGFPAATVGSLSGNTTYYLFVEAENHGGVDSGWASLGSTATLAFLPAAAGSSFPTTDASSMTVAWSRNGNPVDVTTYTVVLTTGASYPNSFPGNRSVSTAPAGSDPYATLTGLISNATYTLYVEAVNHNGIPSGFGGLGSKATLASEPAAAGTTFSVMHVTSMTVTWDRNGNSVDITTYTVALTTGSSYPNSFSGNQVVSTFPAGTDPAATLESLTANTTYNLFIRAINHEDKPTPYSALGTTVTLVYAPASAPTTFETVGITSMSLAWSRNGNPVDVTTYTVVLTTGSSYPNGFGGNRVVSTTPAGGSPAATITSLEPNSTYYFFADAVNHGGGSSGFSALGSTSTLAYAPAAAGTTFPSVNIASMSVAWDRNGNPADVTAYSVVLTSGSVWPNAFAGNQVVSTAPAGASPMYTAGGGLNANTTIYLFVAAVNHDGVYTDYSALGSTSTLAETPVVVGATFTLVHRTSMSVAWDHNGNPMDITTYTVVLTTGSSYPNSFGGNVPLSTAPTWISPAATLTSLQANTTYSLFIEAVNHNGIGSNFAALGTTTTLVNPPVAAGTTFTEAHLSSMTVAWSRNNNGIGVTTYTVVLTTGPTYPNAYDGNKVVSTVPAAASPYALMTSLTANTTYNLFVEALGHDGGVSGYVSLGATATLTYVPAAAAESFVGVDQASMTLAWGRNGNPVDVTTYTVVLTTGASYPNGFAGNRTISTVPVGAFPAASLTGLTPNTTYSLFVDALNHSGAGSGYASLGSTSTLADVPAVPGSAFPDVNRGSMTVAWNRSSNPVAVTTYTVVLTTGSVYPNSFAGNRLVSTAPPGNDPAATLAGLVANTTYTLFVEAVNRGGLGSGYRNLGPRSSLAAEPAAAGTTFDAVHIASVTVAWDGNGNPVDITTYTVVLTTGSSYPNSFSGNKVVSTYPAGASPMAALATLAANTTYNLFIQAVNHEGIGGAFVSFGTTATLVYPPSSAGTTFAPVSITSMSVAWSPNGNPISQTTYTVVLTTGSSYPNAFSGNKTVSTVPAGASPMASFTSLEPNTTYSLFVEAVNRGGTSSNFTSLGSTATLVHPPAAAGAPFAGVDITSMTVAWSRNGNLVDVTTYTVVLTTGASYPNSFTGNRTVSTSPAGASPAATVTGLSANTTYALFVDAVNHGGESSGYTALGSTSSRAYRPSAAGVTFDTVDATSMTVAWSRNGNPVDVTTYTVVLTTGSTYPNAFSGNVPLTTAPAGASPMATITSLAANTTYSLFIQAADHGGLGSAYTALGSTPTGVYPPAAAAPPFTEVNLSSMTVAWDRNGNGVGVTTYTVVLTTGPTYPNAYDGNKVVSTAPAGASPDAILTGLTANTTYNLFVEAVGHDDHGSGYVSMGASATLAYMPAAAAASFVEIDKASMTVAWSRNGNPVDVTTYTVVLTTGSSYPNSFAGNKVVSTLPAGGFPAATLGTLSPNTTYFLFVDALNRSGAGSGYAALGSTSTLAAVPASAGSTWPGVDLTSMTVAWARNGNPVDVTTYTVILTTGASYPNSFGGNRTVSTSPSGTDPAATVTGLIPNTTYALFVDAINHNVLPSGYRAYGSTVSRPAEPSAAGTTFNDVLFNRVDLAWDGNGNPVDVTTYTVVLTTGSSYPNSFGGNQVLSTAPAGASPAARVPGLEPNTTYSLFIEAVGHGGTSSGFTTFGSTSTEARQPIPWEAGQPYDAVHPTSMTVRWERQGNPMNVTTYTVVLSTGSSYPNSFSWNRMLSTAPAGSVTAATLETLEPNTTYFLYFAAVDHGGQSTGFDADARSTSTWARQPAAAGEAFITVDAASMTVAWSRNGNPVGVTTYTVVLTTGSFYPNSFAGNETLSTAPAGASPAATLPNLLPNTTYSLFIEAVNHAGLSLGYTAFGSTCTRAQVPAAAGVTFESLHITSMTVAWDRNGNPVDVTTYTVVLTTGTSYPNSFAGNKTITTAPAGASPMATHVSLGANTTYYLFVEAHNHRGAGSSFSSLGSTSTIANVPASAVPTNLTHSSVTANWGANLNRAGTLYETHASTDNAFSVSNSSLTRNAFAAFSGLDANTTHYFRVRAWGNDGRATEFLALPSTMTLSLPPGVAGVPYPTVETSSAAAAWTDGGNGPGTDYTAQISTDGFATVNLSSVTKNLSVLFGNGGAGDDLTSNTTHYFRVRSEGAGSSGEFVDLGSTSTLASPPLSAATTFYPAASGVLGVSWGANGNPLAFSTYTVEASTASDFTASDQTAITTAPAAGPHATFPSLSINTTYYVRVRAVNHSGLPTTYASLGSTSTLAALPAAAAASFVDVDKGSMTVAWSRNGNPIGLTTYTVVLTTGSSYPNSFAGNKLISTVPAGAFPAATITSLQANTTYSLFVDAVNRSGVSSGYASLGSTSTLAPVPSAAGSTWPGVDVASMTVAWARNGAPVDITTYTVVLTTGASYPNSFAGNKTVSTAPAGTDPAASLTGLAANTTYFLFVGAVNHNGLPAGYAALGEKSTLAGEPAQAAAAFAEVLVTSMTVAWDRAGNPVDVSTYTVALTTGSSYPNAFAGNKVLSTAPAGASPAAAFTALTVNTTYSLFVRTVNHEGTASAYIAMGSTSTRVYAPAAAGTTFLEVYDSSMSVAWSRNGNLASGTTYTVVLTTGTSYPNSFAGNKTRSTAPVGASPQALLAALASNTTYNLLIDAIDHGSRSSGFTSHGTTVTHAAGPSSADPSAVGYSSVTASWGPNGNSPSTVYDARISTDQAFTVEQTSLTLNTEAAFSGLSSNTTYYMRVRALGHSGGDSAFTALPSTITHTQPPAQAAESFTLVEKSSIAVQWDNGGNGPGTYYTVEYSTDDFASVELSSTTRNLSALFGPGGAGSALTPNTTHYFHVRAEGAGGGGQFIGLGSTFTLAAVPSGTDFLTVASTTIEVDWQPNSNPEPGTVYELWMDVTDAFGSPARTTVTTSTHLAEGLAAKTTYYFRVRAVGLDGRYSGFDAAASTRTLPPPPGVSGTPAGTAVGVSSISWSWTAGTDANGYKIYPATEPATEIGSSAGTSFISAYLATNTAYGIVVGAVGEGGTGPLSPSATVYTLAAPPTGIASSSVESTSVTINWSANSNPAGTIAELERSTDNAQFTQVFSGDAVSFQDYELMGCTPYYFRVRYRNGDAVFTAYDSASMFTTKGSTPAPPGSFTAQSLDGRRVQVYWSVSPSSQIAGYRLYYDAGTETIDYTTPIAVLSSTETDYTSDVLVASAAYRFGLRAINDCGVQDGNIDVVASAAAIDVLQGARAAVTVPSAGSRITGDHVTVMAELTLGSPSDVTQVRFQYKASTGTTWADIPAVETEHPNPDTGSPYFIHWDVLGLDTTSYDLRAIATHRSAGADSSPASITLSKDAADPTVNETAAGGKTQSVSNTVDNTVQATDADEGGMTKLLIPAGALDSSTKTVTVQMNPGGAPGAPSDLVGIDIVVDIDLSGQTDLAGGRTAALTVFYPDANDDGIVDGTVVRARDLDIYYYDAGASAWVREFASTVNLASHSITGYTSHFSLFGLFASAATDLSAFRLYPNPFKPNSGSDDDGVAYSPGNANSGIIFDQLPGGANVRIYTVTGQVVVELTASPAGRLQWDVRNSAGHEVASGGYIAVTTGHSKQFRKLLVIR